jgi:DMSO/TMAO reductase YedYZ molybdopterin-dependent catalytic subunit
MDELFPKLKLETVLDCVTIISQVCRLHLEPNKIMKYFDSMTRRLFLKLSGGLLFLAGMAYSLLASFIKSLQVRTVEKDTFKFDSATGVIAWEGNRKEEYRLTVNGLVRKSAAFSYRDLRSLAQVEQVSDFHCVEGWSVQDLKWGGIRFREIMNRVEADPQATHVVFHSLGKTDSTPKGQDHYIESLPIRELLHPDREILLALRMNGDPLPQEHGAPLRLIAPFDLGYKSIKFISRIEFARSSRPGWWTLANPIYPVVARVPANRLRKTPK